MEGSDVIPGLRPARLGDNLPAPFSRIVRAIARVSHDNFCYYRVLHSSPSSFKLCEVGTSAREPSHTSNLSSSLGWPILRSTVSLPTISLTECSGLLCTRP